jgi:MYXO-CTERM domain-containing protein
MRKLSKNLGFIVPALMVAGALAYAPAAQADTATCAQSRCSTAQANLKLEGKDALRTSIDTGWMPSCDGGEEHCNKGLQVRADIALTAAASTGSLFTADMPNGALVQASWEDPRYLVLKTDSLGKANKLTVTHSLTPQVELYLDIGPIEQGWQIPATRLIDFIPGSHFDYQASASAPFEGWAFGGASVTVPAPALQNAQLFSVDLNQLSDVFGKVVTGSLALNATATPTFTYETTRVTVSGKDLTSDATTQYPFPEGDYDYLELPATIEGELSATGSIDVMPSATLSKLGDMNFSPAATITFSSVKVSKSIDAPPQKYTFTDKTIRVPLPNVRRPLEGLDGGTVSLGSDGKVPVVFQNTGEADAVILEMKSDDPRFEPPNKPVKLSPKSKLAVDIAFHPDAIGHAEATITAKTNDPDSPELTFKVTADAVEGPVDGPGASNDDGDPNGPEGAAGDSGCGCKTAGTSSSGSTYAGFGALLLGLVAFTRRRR